MKPNKKPCETGVLQGKSGVKAVGLEPTTHGLKVRGKPNETLTQTDPYQQNCEQSFSDAVGQLAKIWESLTPEQRAHWLRIGEVLAAD
ncbi:MAG: hypothetical protein NXI32_30645 [bacterium]|nr:hypothetical protein [bacterium]